MWNKNQADEIKEVNLKDTDETSRLLALKEGIFVDPRSGGIFYVALEKTKELDEGLIVSISPDSGEKYLSTTLCDPVLCLEFAKNIKLNVHIVMKSYIELNIQRSLRRGFVII